MVVLVTMILCGLLLSPHRLAKAQGLVEYALIIVYVQQVDVNGDGRLERVEGSLRLYADGAATGYLLLQQPDAESRLTIQSGHLWCSAAGPAADFRGVLSVQRGGREERFDDIQITVEPSVTVTSMWIASLGDRYGNYQSIGFAAAGQREFHVDPCG